MKNNTKEAKTKTDFLYYKKDKTMQGMVIEFHSRKPYGLALGMNRGDLLKTRIELALLR